MANGHPKFGATNGVDALDIGQLGGTRAAAGQALWVGRVDEHPADVAYALHSLPGQNAVYKSVQGFTGQRVIWRGTIKTDTRARLRTILGELDAYRHGGLETPDPAQLKATQLTSSDGAALSSNAVMLNWRMTSDVHAITGGPFAAMVTVEIEFSCLR